MTLIKQGGGYLLTAVNLTAYGGLVYLSKQTGTLRNSHVPETIGWYLLAFTAFCGAVVWAEVRGFSRQWVWGTAVLFRVLLLFTAPTLSDDVYRYMWDGYVANESVSPYAYAIDSPELDYLDIPIRDQANNTWMASPYLPAAQWLFRGITAVFPLSPLYFQIAMVLFDLGTAYLLSLLLKATKLPPHRIILYLWNPLVIIEIAHSAHLDAWMLFLTFLAIVLTVKQSTFNIQHSTTNNTPSPSHRFTLSPLHPFIPPLLLALATLTKLLPALLFPILFWQWNWRQRISYGVFTLLFLIPAGLRAGWGLSGDLDGTGLFGALRIYGRQWNFNSGIFHWLALILQKQGDPSPTDTAKLFVFVLLAGALTAVWLTARHHTAPAAALRLTAVPFLTYILLTPTVHPWYALIVIAILPFLPPGKEEPRVRWLLVTPWLYLSGALIFSYLTYLDPQSFGELEWVRNVEWIPTLVLWGTAVIILFTQKRT